MEFETSEFTIAGIRVIDSPGDDVFQISFPCLPSIDLRNAMVRYGFRHKGINVWQRDRSAGIEFLMMISRSLIEEYLGGEVR